MLMVMFSFSVLDWKLFLSKFGPIYENYLFNTKLGAYNNSSMLNSMAMLGLEEPYLKIIWSKKSEVSV